VARPHTIYAFLQYSLASRCTHSLYIQWATRQSGPLVCQLPPSAPFNPPGTLEYMCSIFIFRNGSRAMAPRYLQPDSSHVRTFLCKFAHPPFRMPSLGGIYPGAIHTIYPPFLAGRLNRHPNAALYLLLFLSSTPFVRPAHTILAAHLPVLSNVFSQRIFWIGSTQQCLDAAWAQDVQGCKSAAFGTASEPRSQEDCSQLQDAHNGSGASATSLCYGVRTLSCLSFRA